ncbi:VanZ family protein [Streptomyces misionensis]|uniref:VanZ family protein n=1 Tax=Streptomyces misionensis TaxID=67331 RepID=A0A5C6J200_9ACTN|nr:VanZ family protein [Streptomyces misionensis]TWV34743.1 VanZ family protein [Streptomyces misionensis]
MWEVILYLNPVTVSAFVLFCAVIPWVGAALASRTQEVIPKLARVLLVLCLAIIYFATLMPTQPLDSGGPRYISWVPGEGLWDNDLSSMGAMEHEMSLRLQLANAMMFVPLGILLLFVTRQPRLGRTIAICLALSVSIEAAQYVMNAGRTADVDDALFNTLGGIIGGVLAFVPRRVLAERSVEPGVLPLADQG